MGTVLSERATDGRTARGARSARASRARAGAERSVADLVADRAADRAAGRPQPAGRTSSRTASRSGRTARATDAATATATRTRGRGVTVPAQRGASAPAVERRSGSTRTPARPDRARRSPAARAERAAAAGRSRFVLVMMLLLGTGLVATLWLSTAAAADSYRLDDARTAARQMAEQSERLHREVASLNSPTSLAERAGQMGMVPVQDAARLVVEPSGEVVVVGEPVAATTPAPILAPAAPAQPGQRPAVPCPAPTDEGNTAATCADEAAAQGAQQGTTQPGTTQPGTTQPGTEGAGATGTATGPTASTGQNGQTGRSEQAGEEPITPGAVPFTGPRSGTTAATASGTATTTAPSTASSTASTASTAPAGSASSGPAQGTG